jgi:hypothetical protein
MCTGPAGSGKAMATADTSLLGVKVTWGSNVRDKLIWDKEKYITRRFIVYTACLQVTLLQL